MGDRSLVYGRVCCVTLIASLLLPLHLGRTYSSIPWRLRASPGVRLHMVRFSLMRAVHSRRVEHTGLLVRLGHFETTGHRANMQHVLRSRASVPTRWPPVRPLGCW